MKKQGWIERVLTHYFLIGILIRQVVSEPGSRLAIEVKSSKEEIDMAEELNASFAEIATMIQETRQRAYQAVNTLLLDLYWRIGKYISQKVEAGEWRQSVVQQLADYLKHQQVDQSGFSASNLWRMKQFYETYRDAGSILAPLVRELPWSHNLLILGRCKTAEEREFYLRLAKQERWSKRELERQLNGALFERVMLAAPSMSAALTQIHPGAEVAFRDSYLLDFLELPSPHTEADLQQAMVSKLKEFLLELGRDFTFVGENYVLQVGKRDFRADLLFFHRDLQCLVAFELKIGEFEPSHLGQLAFYLEALDRDVRKPHERPSIGVLLCASKDSEVVEYALSRTAAPTLVAEYQTRLPDRAVLQRKLAEFYARETERRV
jgi:predicted nuclease of restriction endonuclease-like (RecB) superfamily